MGGVGNARTNSEVVGKGSHHKDVAHPNTWRFGNPRTSLSRSVASMRVKANFGMNAWVA